MKKPLALHLSFHPVWDEQDFVGMPSIFQELLMYAEKQFLVIYIYPSPRKNIRRIYKNVILGRLP